MAIRKSTAKTLSDLVAYTKRHFAAEERLMQVHHCPDYPPHKAEHDALTQKVVKLQQDFTSSHVALTGEIMKFLSDWLNHHIGEIDKGRHVPAAVGALRLAC